MTFYIRVYKDYNRVNPINMGSGVDTRLFYLYLKEHINTYKKAHPTLNKRSILISANGRETYRKRNKLEEANIITIQDMIDYLEIEPKIIIMDGKLTEDRTTHLSEIYVLELK